MTAVVFRTIMLSVRRSRLWEMVLMGALLTGAVIAVAAASLFQDNNDLLWSAIQFALSAVVALVVVLIYGELRRARRERERSR
jgi:membrane protein YdbS with pleckstrin-like domain